MSNQAAPRVSVIMAAYNTDKWIASAIRSVLDQTFTDFELLVIDDGSTDLTYDVVRQYAQQDHRVLAYKFNHVGVVAARNFAIRKARGEYVAIMDSDDIAMPNRLAKQVAFLDENPDIVAVTAGMAVINRQIAVPDNLSALRVRTVLECPTGRLEGLNLLRSSVFHGVAMIRRKAMLDIGLYRPFFVHAEDADFFMRLEEVGSIRGLADVLYLQRRHLENTGLRFPYVQTESSVLAQIVARRRRRDKPDRVYALRRPFIRIFQIGLSPLEIAHALVLIGTRYIRRLRINAKRHLRLRLLNPNSTGNPVSAPPPGTAK